jgi:hypothetical protein
MLMRSMLTHFDRIVRGDARRRLDADLHPRLDFEMTSSCFDHARRICDFGQGRCATADVEAEQRFLRRADGLTPHLEFTQQQIEVAVFGRLVLTRIDDGVFTE